MKIKNRMKFFAQTCEMALPVNLFLAGNKAAVAVLVLLTLVLSSHIAVAGPHPNMYLNQSEIDAIQVKVSAKEEPWYSAYNLVMSAADAALNQPLLSVTFQGRTSNLYHTGSPYCGWPATPEYPNGCRDGQINPNADRGDYVAAIKLGDFVRDLGLAYAFTGQARYAEKAIDFIRVWSLDRETRMVPDTAWRIELYITIPGMFYGADLIWNYDGWDATEKEAFRAWVKTISGTTKIEVEKSVAAANGTASGLNNFANWRLVLIASAGALLDDNTLLDFVEAQWKHLVSVQMSAAGSSRPGLLGQEFQRTRGLHYSLYAINAMIQSAEIMRHRNVNLYDYKDSGGRGLELALDAITPYAINPGSWPYEQITTITQKDSMAMYELAYSYYQKESYQDVITQWKRPMDEHRIMGITTLTHASPVDSNVPATAPSIVTQPEDITVTEGEEANFSVTVSGSAPLTYQWYRAGVAIDGATDASYTLSAVSPLDTGSYYCKVVNDLGEVNSNDVMLTVLPDATAPTLVSAVATRNTRVDVRFNEPVSASSAEESSNYQVNLGIMVAAAKLSDDGHSVSLTVDPLAEETTYTVSVSNVEDLAQSPNTITAMSNQSFTYRTAYGFEDGQANDWEPLTPERWSVVMDEGDMVYFLNTTSFPPLSGLRLGEYSLLPDTYGDFTFTAQAKLGDNVASNGLADYAVVFGFQDDENYYYAMFNAQQSATQISRVIDGQREELVTADVDWLNDNEYHSIEVSRKGSAISVRFDGNEIMAVNDDSLGAGRVGVGSYNDAAYFDEVSVVGTALAAPDDTTPPTITLIGDNPLTITMGDAFADPGATASDNRDGNISANITIDDSTVDPATVGSYSVTYNVTDAAGNAAIQATRMVNVVAVIVPDDTTPPLITLIGDNPQTITIDSMYSELGASASDNVDGNISVNITINTSAVDTTIAGSYSVTYNISDTAGNVATEVVRTVNVTNIPSVTTAEIGNVDDSNGGGGSFSLLLLAMLLVKFSIVFTRHPFASLERVEGNV